MLRRKKSAVDRFLFSEPLSALFANQEIYDKLRADLFASTEKLEHQLIALRNSIPAAFDSDARNVTHETVVTVEECVDSIRNNLDLILNRRIKRYKKIRAGNDLKKLWNASKKASTASFDCAAATQPGAMEKLLLRRNEVRDEGLSMSQFHGRMGESVDHYYDQVFQHLQAKNINYEDPANNTRILAMVASNLKHNAYAWYRIHNDSISNLQDLMAGLTQGFVPPALQERLRDQLYSLHQRKCSSLEDYISGRGDFDRRLDECSSEASADSPTLEEKESWHGDFNNAEQENYETNEPTISIEASVTRDVATAVDNATGVAPTEATQQMGGFSRNPNKRTALLASPTTQRLDRKQKTKTSDIASSFTQVEREKLQSFKAETDS